VQVLYISNGNIPSRWAHTVQTMKMSEAFAQRLPGFVLVVACDLRGLLVRKRSLFEWYGIRRSFPLRRLVIAKHCDAAQLQKANVREFADHARRYARRRRPRIVYTRNHESALFALQDGFPVIFETHDGPGHPKTTRYLGRFAEYANLRGVVTTSAILEDYFVNEGIPREKIIVRMNGVDLERFSEIGVDRRSARRTLGLGAKDPLVLYAGSLKEHKGIGTLIDAAHLLPSVQFLTLGGTLEEIAIWQQKSPPANLRFVPFVPNAEIPRWLEAADVCVVPNSRTDRTAAWTFSLKLYEYLAARRPTIVSAIPSLTSVITDGQNGLIVPPDDAKALARAIDRLLTDRNLFEAIGSAGYLTACGCTWEQRARDIIQRFAPELKQRPLPHRSCDNALRPVSP